MNIEEQAKKMNQIIAKCWADEAFKAKLLADPAATLKAEGAEVPAGLTVKAVENTDQVFHLVIPAKPTDLSDEDLDKVAAGVNLEMPARATKEGREAERMRVREGLSSGIWKHWKS